MADANGQNGILGLLLNPSAPTFQPGIGDQRGEAANPSQADLGRPPDMGPMSMQQYEVLCNPNYVAD